MSVPHEHPTRLEVLYLLDHYNHYKNGKEPVKAVPPTEEELKDIRKIDESDDTEFIIEIDNFMRNLWDMKQHYAKHGECRDGQRKWDKIVESAADFLSGTKKAKGRAEEEAARK